MNRKRFEIQNTIQPEPDGIHFRCRHIFTDGHRCGSKCLHGESFCYYHHTSRRPAPDRHANLVANRKAMFDLPLFEDRSAIQAGIQEIANRIATRQIDSRRAALLLYAMQIALQTHPRMPIAAPAAAPETVDEVTLHPTLGLIAPEAGFIGPEREKTLEEVLMEQWNREP